MSVTRTSVIEDIKEHLSKITPGPWRWGGNTKFGDVEIVAWGKYGRQSVLRQISVDRTADDPRIADLDEEEIGMSVETAREEFLLNADGTARTDTYLGVNVDWRMVLARDLAVYEVCPEALSRSDVRVYREDVVGVRHDDAAFLVMAPTYVGQLLEEITTLQERIAVLENERVAMNRVLL
jgi:hypothetical protein